ncbi:NAD(P)H-dependent glycerol-3-phosphate dehydrogenase [Roseobacter sinensis]|uniref:Glycerol-3-phosphate dehydrogenase [NAD(P)+] n=1 Tax=Roseobacter sinensis TaxID=2931391 RepID=A0ABT3B8R7_9RHOB|nr:NAD(P)H-dependent glycerol-3-phosphate dehydrogenase [Roseobacter sp. WL0113]MCV3269977.1 NAD(P)-dependent glycerol-3-phosphate dehydrogenase [Roseobacter sp. WL0113]
MSVAVLGGGAFGTALAVALSQRGPVTLWCRAPAQADDMANRRVNERYLPGCTLPADLTITADLTAAADAKILLLAVPMQQLGRFARDEASHLDGKILVACCKGMDLRSGAGPVETLAQHCPTARVALLTGPSFARDIARGLPTGLTLACADAGLGETLQHQLATPALRLYRTTDVIGATLGGALKNVMAIACGATIGAGLGESARASILTRGFAEMQRLALLKGAVPQTLAGLSGFGDLVLTCTSEQSRNYRFGLAIGRDEAFDASMTVEGAATAQAAARLAQREGIDLPITSAVAGLVEKRLDVAQAMDALLSRTLKEE